MATSTTRIGFHADESYVDDNGHYVVIEVVENEPGYRRTPFTSADLTKCIDAAKTMNTSNGLTDDDVLAIRTSSMAAGNVR